MGERLRRRFRNTDRRIPSDLLSNRVDDRALTLESSPLYEPFTGLIADGFNGGPRAPWCSRLDSSPPEVEGAGPKGKIDGNQQIKGKAPWHVRAFRPTA